MSCDVFVGWPKTQLPVECLFPQYALMHSGGNKLNLNLNISGLLLQEIYTSTDTSWGGIQVLYWPGSGRLGGDQVNKMTGYESMLVL